LKAITYHHLLLKICTCGTIRGCATIKINHENKAIYTQIVMHWDTIQICTTNQVNTVCFNVTFTHSTIEDIYILFFWEYHGLYLLSNIYHFTNIFITKQM